MPTRLRWFEVKLPSGATVDTFISYAIKRRFKKDGLEGFLLDVHSGGNIRGRYIRREIVVQELVDPFGNTTTNEQIKFLECGFELSSKFPHLLLKNPSRNYRDLFSHLSRAYALGISITPIKFLLSKVLQSSAFKKHDWILSNLKVENISLGVSSYASLAVSSSDNAFRDVAVLLGNRKFDLEFIDLSSRDSTSGGTLRLVADGRIVIGGKVSKEVESFLTAIVLNPTLIHVE